MSTSNRKIGFYSFIFEKYRTKDDEKYFDPELFKSLLEYIFALQDEEKILRIEKSNKAVSIDAHDISKVSGHNVVKIVFKSCKFNHSPEYMSSIDGTERESDKKSFEGEKEKTHLCITIGNNDAEVILEERRSGVSINTITRYLNGKLTDYLNAKDEKRDFKIVNGIVPVKNFLSELKKMKSIKVADIYTHKKVLGSSMLGILEREDAGMKEEILLTAKAKQKENIAQMAIRACYGAVGTTVSRLRVYGSDIEGKFVKLDTDKMKKTESIDVGLDTNGIVDTGDMFSKMMVLLGVDE